MSGFMMKAPVALAEAAAVAAASHPIAAVRIPIVLVTVVPIRAVDAAVLRRTAIAKNPAVPVTAVAIRTAAKTTIGSSWTL